MDKHPGRALVRPRPLGASRRRASRKAELGAGDAGLLGAVRDPRWRRYLMYYSATHDACHDPERGHCLAVATSPSPAGPFVDMGMPLLLGVGFEYIDPMAFDDPASGKRLLYWGSGLPADQGAGAGRGPDVLRSGQRADRPRLAQPVEGAFPRLVEAAWVIHHDDFYYLFYSGDNCCGPDAEYGVMVARSREPTGPFETLEEARGVPHSLMLLQKRALARAGAQLHRDRQGRPGVDHLSRDRREPPAPAAGGRDQQPPDPADRPHRVARRLAFVGTPSDEPQAAPIT